MKKTIRLIGAMCIATAGTYAGTVTFTVSGADTGLITFALSGNTITGVSGTFDGSTITNIVAPGGLGGNNNVYYSASPYLDDSGVSFQLSTPDAYGFTFVNLYDVDGVLGDGTIQADSSPSSNASDFSVDTLTPPDMTLPDPPAVPEPGTVGLTLAGVGMLFAARCRRHRRVH